MSFGIIVSGQQAESEEGKSKDGKEGMRKKKRINAWNASDS